MSEARYNPHDAAAVAYESLPAMMGSANNFRVKFFSGWGCGSMRTLYQSRSDVCVEFGC